MKHEIFQTTSTVFLRYRGSIAQFGQGSNLPGMGYRPIGTMFVPTQQYMPQRSVGMAQVGP